MMTQAVAFHRSLYGVHQPLPAIDQSRRSSCLWLESTQNLVVKRKTRSASVRLHNTRPRALLNAYGSLRSQPLQGPSTTRDVHVKSFLNQLFGNKKSTTVQLAESDLEATEYPELDALEDGGELVLTEAIRDDGSVASLVYRNGGVIDAAEVDGLCAKIAWPRRPIEKLAAALQNSYLVSHIHLRIATNDESEERLIAMARATSDHAFNATIWDVMVDPEFQGKGLGKCLVEQMVRTLLRREITNISLFADAAVVRFYERMGFEADVAGIKGMFWSPPR